MLKSILQGLIKAYMICISPLIRPSCRFMPTCSCYAHEALEKHGGLKGLWLTMRRLLKCHPWSKHHGLDPVPERYNWPIDLGRLIRYNRSQEIRKNKS